jgi:ArsR family transcriptional regulator
VPVSNRIPNDPAAAANCCGPLDDLLDAELFAALGEPSRTRLLACLVKCARPCTTTELAACCAVDFSVVTRHLRVLERAGLVTASKRGRTVSFAVDHRALTKRFRNLATAIAGHRPGRRSTRATKACHAC